jgi:tetratricopeptide (TPR) repeat protein
VARPLLVRSPQASSAWRISAAGRRAARRKGDVGRAEQLGRKALDVSEDDESRIDAVAILETAAWWRGRLREAEAYAEEELEIARRLERRDLECDALLDLAGIYVSRREGERAEPVIERALELAEESGSLTAKARALTESGELHVFRGRPKEALAEVDRARDLFAEVGAATNLARTIMRIGRLLARRGQVAQAEKLFRESIGILGPLEDRGTLCEVQRSLAEILLEQGGRSMRLRPTPVKRWRQPVRMTSARRRQPERRSRWCEQRRVVTTRPRCSSASRSQFSSRASTRASFRSR